MPYLVVPATNNDPDSLVGAIFYPEALPGAVLDGLTNGKPYRVYSVATGPIFTPRAGTVTTTEA